MDSARTPGNEKRGRSDPQIIVIGPALLQAEIRKPGFGDFFGKVAVGIHRLVISQDTDQARIDRKGTNWPEHGFLELLFRSEAGFLHDRIHPAAHKIDIRKTFLQIPVDPCGIGSHKMMETDQEDGNCPWTVRKPVDRISHSLDRDVLKTPLIKVFLFQQYT